MMDHVSPDRFKQSMRRLASTVSIVTAVEQGERFGMIATAVTAMSASPASIALGVNREASIHEAIIRTGHFCVNFLRPDHRGLVSAFSTSRLKSQRFQEGNWRTGIFCLPFLEDAEASLFCALDGQLEYETHSLFVGKIFDLECSTQSLPLIWHDGQFGTINRM